MIKFVIARHDTDGFDAFFNKSKFKFNHPIVHITNEHLTQNNLPNSIFQKYNLGIEYYQSNGLDDNDIVVFCHADVTVLDEAYNEKLEYAFSKLNIDVAGVIGTTHLFDSAGWWLCDQQFHRGHLIQWQDDTNKYHMNRVAGNFTDLAVVDGLFMAVRGSLLKKQKFDVETFPTSYDFYDYDFCLTALENGSNVGVLDILVEHKSAGMGIFNESWKNNKDIFINKWINKGYQFPISVNSFKR